MTGWLDEQWVGTELLPLLTHVFGHVDPASGKMWAVIVREVVSYIDFVPIWEDFDSTIERIRLLLVNPAILADAERKEIDWVGNHAQLCAAIFVRHQVRHGVYSLFSLGVIPDPDHSRPVLTTEKEKKEYVYGGKLAANQHDAELSPRSWKVQARRRDERKAARAADKSAGISRVYKKVLGSRQGRMVVKQPRDVQRDHECQEVPECRTEQDTNMHQTKQVLTRLIGETKGQISGDASAVDRKGSGLREVLGPNSSATSSPTASMDGSNSNISADQNDENISPSRFRRADAHENETQQSRSSLLKGGLFLRGGAIKFQPGLSAHQL